MTYQNPLAQADLPVQPTKQAAVRRDTLVDQTSYQNPLAHADLPAKCIKEVEIQTNLALHLRRKKYIIHPSY